MIDALVEVLNAKVGGAKCFNVNIGPCFLGRILAGSVGRKISGKELI